MKFDLYEYIGVIVPGAIVLLAASLLYPSVLPTLTSSLSLGDLGLVLILAFVAGHLVQAGGNLWESIVWGISGGMPTCWVADPKKKLLSQEQLTRLDARLTKEFECKRSSLKSGRGPMREIFVRVRKLGKPDRIDKFNRNYGLMRGVAVSFLASALMVLVHDVDQWKGALLLVALAGISTFRMVRFGIHYAREIYAEYLSLDIASTKTKSKPKT